MLIHCQTKKCFSEDHHLLDETSNEVNCLKCGNEISLPDTTKRMLKNFGQIKKDIKTGMQVKCRAEKCGFTGKPLVKKLSGATNLAVCRKCGKQLDMHGSMLMVLAEIPEFTTANKEAVVELKLAADDKIIADAEVELAEALAEPRKEAVKVAPVAEASDEGEQEDGE